MNKESIWEYAVQRGIIDPDGVLLLMKKEEILKQHKYKITKGKDRKRCEARRKEAVRRPLLKV